MVKYCRRLSQSDYPFGLPASSRVSGGQSVAEVILQPLRHCAYTQPLQELHQRRVVGQVVPLKQLIRLLVHGLVESTFAFP